MRVPRACASCVCVVRVRRACVSAARAPLLPHTKVYIPKPTVRAGCYETVRL